MTFTNDELNLIREWYDAVSDVSRQYLGERDHELAKKIKRAMKGSAEQSPIGRK